MAGKEADDSPWGEGEKVSYGHKAYPPGDGKNLVDSFSDLPPVSWRQRKGGYSELGCREMERRKYDREFKLEVLHLVQEGKQSAAQIARDFDIGENLIDNGRGLSRKNQRILFPGKGNLRREEAYVRQLEKDLKRVTEERDILKKVLAIFSKTPQ